MISSSFPIPYKTHIHIMLDSYIGCFKKENIESKDKDLLLIPIRNSFRLMEQWRYDFYSLPSRFDSGIDREEASEVYGILERVFKEEFPSHAEFSRDEAAVYMERIISAVHREMVEGTVELPGAKQDLIRFLEHVRRELGKSDAA